MSPPPYDPQKAHQYYEEHKHLKGRHPGQGRVPPAGRGTRGTVTRLHPGPNQATKVAAQQRVIRLTQKIAKLSDALKKAEQALQNKRDEARKNSDGKTTAKERQASKKYRDTHKSEIASKEKSKSSTSGSSSSSSSSSSPKTLSSMSESELVDRVDRIHGLIKDARRQLQAANSLAHSMSETNFISHSGRSTVPS